MAKEGKVAIKKKTCRKSDEKGKAKSDNPRKKKHWKTSRKRRQKREGRYNHKM